MASYKKRLEEIERNTPQPYVSPYQSQIDSLMQRINNREKFSYDFNADPLYQSYKDTYTKLGKEAAMNAAAATSALTGGFGNSYGATAAAQANQQYLTQLNQTIPGLYDAARSRYQMESDELNGQLSNLMNAESVAYGRYRDAVGDYNNQRDYLAGMYNAQLAAAAKSAGKTTPDTPVETPEETPEDAQALSDKDLEKIRQQYWKMQGYSATSADQYLGAQGLSEGQHSYVTDRDYSKIKNQYDEMKKMYGEQKAVELIADYIVGLNLSDDAAFEILDGILK